MPESIGGLVFIPKQVSPAALIKRILAGIGESRFTLLSNHQRDPYTHQSLGEIHGELSADTSDELERRVITIDVEGGFLTTMWVHIQDETYDCLWITLYAASSFIVENRDPANVVFFAEFWVKICEAAQAQFGSFTALPIPALEHSYQQTKVRLLQNEIDDLVEQSGWICYIGPQDAAKWGEEDYLAWQEDNYPTQRARKIVHHPSHAMIFHGFPGYNPVEGDADAKKHAAWVLRSLLPHVKILGVDKLREQIEYEQNVFLPDVAKQQRDLDKQPFSKRDRAVISQLHGDLHESHIRLDLIRSLWAAAYQRPGLVGVNQSVTLVRENGQEDVVVPIIADQGREWLLVSNHDPLAIKDTTWTGHDEHLEPRVRDLLVAAQQHPIAGHPPRVVVFCWKGIADDMRSTLSMLGAQIEVAPVPVPLLEP